MIAYRFTQNYDDASDIRQEVFVRAWKNISHLKDESKAGSWIISITYNYCKNFYRNKKDFTPLSENYSGETKEIRGNESSMVADALALLPANQRMAIILLEYENKSYKEIAESLNTNISSVKSLIFRARGNLRNSLDKTKIHKHPEV